MVLGTTYYHAARASRGSRWNQTRALPAFRNACLTALTLVGVVVANDSPSPPSVEVATTKNADSRSLPLSVPSPKEETLPSPESVQHPNAQPALPPPQSVEKTTTAPPVLARKDEKNPQPSPTSVLLPPISYEPDARSASLPSHAPPLQQAASTPAPHSSLLEPPPTLGGVAKPTAPNTTIEVIVGQPRVLTFPDVPHRIALAVNENDPLATLREVPHRPCEWYLIGKKPGTTYLDVWLPDPTNAVADKVLHHLIRIQPEGAPAEKPVEMPQATINQKSLEMPRATINPKLTDPPPMTAIAKPVARPAAKVVEPPAPLPSMKGVEPSRSDLLYQTVEQEINRTFPGSTVHLKQVGDTLVVSGTARDIFEATRILTIARQHAPGARSGSAAPEPPSSPSTSQQAILDNYSRVGGPHVVNLLRIPGEQQIMLRIVVAEVNRSAARKLGLDFGIGDKQATILGNHPPVNGSSTVAQNGWIGQLIRTLQNLHYAQTLAEPTLTTLNGQAARFQAGGEFPVPVAVPSQHGAVPSVTFRSYGVHLNVQPVITDADRIRLTVDAEVSGLDAQASAQVGNTAIPGLKVRNFQSTVELREGETLAVAGLVRGAHASTLPQNVRPEMDNAPMAEQELVVLISPLLLHPSSADQWGGANALNPQDVELYLRSRNVHLPCGDALYLIGPQGYAGTARSNAAARR